MTEKTLHVIRKTPELGVYQKPEEVQVIKGPNAQRLLKMSPIQHLSSTHTVKQWGNRG